MKKKLLFTFVIVGLVFLVNSGEVFAGCIANDCLDDGGSGGSKCTTNGSRTCKGKVTGYGTKCGSGSTVVDTTVKGTCNNLTNGTTCTTSIKVPVAESTPSGCTNGFKWEELSTNCTVSYENKCPSEPGSGCPPGSECGPGSGNVCRGSSHCDRCHCIHDPISYEVSCSRVDYNTCNKGMDKDVPYGVSVTNKSSTTTTYSWDCVPAPGHGDSTKHCTAKKPITVKAYVEHYDGSLQEFGRAVKDKIKGNGNSTGLAYVVGIERDWSSADNRGVDYAGPASQDNGLATYFSLPVVVAKNNQRTFIPAPAMADSVNGAAKYYYKGVIDHVVTGNIDNFGPDSMCFGSKTCTPGKGTATIYTTGLNKDNEGWSKPVQFNRWEGCRNGGSFHQLANGSWNFIQGHKNTWFPGHSNFKDFKDFWGNYFGPTYGDTYVKFGNDCYLSKRMDELDGAYIFKAIYDYPAGECDYDNPHHCKIGISNTINDSATQYKWKCESTQCVANKPKDGECGRPKPNHSSNKCHAGLASSVTTGSDYYSWTCSGSDGGKTANCFEERPKNSVACSDPADHNNQCTKGTASDIVVKTYTDLDGNTNKYWEWLCYSDTETKVCREKVTATSPIDGQCSSTVDKCAKGTYKNVLDSATQINWSCVGLNGGSTAQCHKNKTKFVLKSRVYSRYTDGGVIGDKFVKWRKRNKKYEITHGSTNSSGQVDIQFLTDSYFWFSSGNVYYHIYAEKSNSDENAPTNFEKWDNCNFASGNHCEVKVPKTSSSVKAVTMYFKKIPEIKLHASHNNGGKKVPHHHKTTLWLTGAFIKPGSCKITSNKDSTWSITGKSPSNSATYSSHFLDFPSDNTTTFTATCKKNTDNTDITSTVVVGVKPAVSSLSLDADDYNIDSGDAVKLRARGSHMSNCTITNTSANPDRVVGSSLSLDQWSPADHPVVTNGGTSQRYQVSCDRDAVAGGGKSTATADITVNRRTFKVTIKGGAGTGNGTVSGNGGRVSGCKITKETSVTSGDCEGTASEGVAYHLTGAPDATFKFNKWEWDSKTSTSATFNSVLKLPASLTTGATIYASFKDTREMEVTYNGPKKTFPRGGDPGNDDLAVVNGTGAPLRILSGQSGRQETSRGRLTLTTLTDLTSATCRLRSSTNIQGRAVNLLIGGSPSHTFTTAGQYASVYFFVNGALYPGTGTLDVRCTSNGGVNAVVKDITIPYRIEPIPDVSEH